MGWWWHVFREEWRPAAIGAGATLAVTGSTLTLSGASTIDLGGSLILSGGNAAGTSAVTFSPGLS